MTREDRLRELFEQACALPEERREAFVGRACENDPVLREELAALLHADALGAAGQGTEALEQPVGVVAAGVVAKVDRPRTPERIGPYRIVERLGAGGMGVVYRAEQDEPIRREVAVKLIGGGLDSASVVARFEAERQVLALMDHPNIARVYDAGATDDGLPYFAMEYVRGVPITAYCDEQRLTHAERLRLFLQVCAGVQHAHQKGVIHRDLKPSNILVTDDGGAVPKIIDFGISKATGEGRPGERTATRTGSMVGTLEYMSPEQARGRSEEIDLRSDVYSLGVVLFELLSGTLPHDLSGLSVTEALRRISEAPLRPLTSGRRRLPEDLQKIVLKAFEQDPARRYQSPGALADDIERYLAGRPILARPPSVAYLARKLVWRHKLPSALVAVLLVVLAVAYVLNVAERRHAEREALIASSVSDILLSIVHSADPLGPSGPDRTVREVLDEFDESKLDRLEGLPEVEYRVRFWLASAYGSLGAFDRAYPQRLRLESLLLEMGADTRSAELADVRFHIGWDLHEMARYAESAAYFRKVGESGPVDGTRRTEARVGLADTLTHLGEYDEARRHGLAALREYSSGKLEEPQTGMLLVILSNLERAVGDLDAAESYARRAVEFETSTKSTPDGNTLLAARNLAAVLLEREQCAEAERILRDEETTLARLYPPGHVFRLQVASLLGGCLLCEERWEDAELALRGVDPRAAGFKFLDEHETADAIDRVTTVYGRLGQPEKAAAYRALVASTAVDTR